jgi:hypothetical protein
MRVKAAAAMLSVALLAAGAVGAGPADAAPRRDGGRQAQAGAAADAVSPAARQAARSNGAARSRRGAAASNADTAPAARRGASPQPVVHQHSARASGQGVAALDARQASARYLCPRGGQPQRGGRCRGEGAAYAGAAGGLRWQAGLPPAEHVQRECPSGTLATLAHGHTDVVRCMPL